MKSHVTGGAITNQVLVEIQLNGAHHAGIVHAIVVQPAHLPSGYKYPVIKSWYVSTAPSVYFLCLLCSGQSHHGSNGEVHFHQVCCSAGQQSFCTIHYRGINDVPSFSIVILLLRNLVSNSVKLFVLNNSRSFLQKSKQIECVSSCLQGLSQQVTARDCKLVLCESTMQNLGLVLLQYLSVTPCRQVLFDSMF